MAEKKASVKNRHGRSLLRVSVHDSHGLPYQSVTEVELVGAKSLTPIDGGALYEGIVNPNTYRIRVTPIDGPYEAQERSVYVPPIGKTVSIYLGKPGWPSYRYGENIIPFEPLDELIAICLETNAQNFKRDGDLVNEITNALNLSSLSFNEDGGEPSPISSQGAILIVPGSSEFERQDILRITKKILGEEAQIRVGMPINLNPGQFKVIDSRYVVRFQAHVDRELIDALIEANEAKILRNFIQSNNTFLIDFGNISFSESQDIIDKWDNQGFIKYGEPDLITEGFEGGFPFDSPTESKDVDQPNLALQNVDKAWQFLYCIDKDLTLGSPNVHVASFDTGILINHPDIGGKLTDLSPQLSHCFDLSNCFSCANTSYKPVDGHGMGVYGIISARTNNKCGISGIAPNVHHIAMVRQVVVGGVNYTDSLLWAAGFATPSLYINWPKPPNPGADIINCSHGVPGLAISGLMNDTLNFLSNYGRQGKGTLVIYSAGNSSERITGFFTWAAHERTIAVSNSGMPQPYPYGVEERIGNSNFGPEIDICAQGEGANSLSHTGPVTPFYGTSAAAPTVAAAAALMISVEPNLEWWNIRDILRDTSVVIDHANANWYRQWNDNFSQSYGYGRLDVGAAVKAAYYFYR
ncbi:MAG: subtilisin family serine protease [Bermanella sp.]|jgi:subtilisin family serine protease